MKRHFLLFTALTMTLILCVFSISPRAKGEKELVFGFALNPAVRNTSFGGKGAADLRELFQNLFDEVQKQFGYTVTTQIYPSLKFLEKAFQKKEADFATGTLSQFLYLRNHGVPIKPLFANSTEEKKETQYCIYVRKDSGIKTIKQLKGKRFVHDFPALLSRKDMLPFKENYIYWIMIKKVLLKNGVNARFVDFFKEFRVLPVVVESVAYAVYLKNFDAFHTNQTVFRSLINYDKGFLDLTPLSCLEVPVGPPLVYREDVNPEIIKKAKDYFLHGSTEMKAAKEMKKAFKGIKIFIVEDKDYDIYFQWLKEAEQKGWIKEFDDIMKKVPRPKK